MGSGMEDPLLQMSEAELGLFGWQHKCSRVLFALTLSLILLQPGANAEQGDSKKPGLDPVAASQPPASKSAMGESPTRQSSAQSLPKPDAAKTGTGGKGAENASKSAASETPPAADNKPPLPFPVISGDAAGSAAGVQGINSRTFPSAIDIHGSAAGVLLHARKETRYDLLSPLSIWLEEGPLLVSVRKPSEMVLVATKFGDVCIVASGDALVERGEEDTLRIVNLCTSGDTVFLNMHDKLWTGSPWGHAGKVQQLRERKGKKKTYDEVESGAISIAPGYELVIGAQGLTVEDVKPPDSVGRREIRAFEGGRFVISEICIDHLTQLHDLIKNLNTHGEKASAVFAEIMKNAGQMRSKQGESGFEKNVPAPPKPPEPKRKPPPKAPASKTPPAATTPDKKPPTAAGTTPASTTPPAKKSTTPGTAPTTPAK